MKSGAIIEHWMEQLVDLILFCDPSQFFALLEALKFAYKSQVKPICFLVYHVIVPHQNEYA